MIDDATPRWALDLLWPGQAQKEMTHNEALARIDMLLQPVAVAAGLNAPPAAPEDGQCWIVGDAPSGDWSGQAKALAGWSAAGWRFVAPREGCRIWVADRAGIARFLQGQWVYSPAIANPGGGATVDTEARAAISALLTALRRHGLVSV